MDPDDWTPITVKPQYVFRDREIIDHDVRIIEKRVAERMVAGRMALEASGNITLDTIAEVAKSGVDYASSGWITHSAPNLDVALDIEM